MNYVELTEQTKQYVLGDEELKANNEFNFQGAKILSMKIDNKEIEIKFLMESKKVYVFKLHSASMLNFEMNRYSLLVDGDRPISEIDISLTGDKVYSLSIGLKGMTDYRFMCGAMEFVAVEEMDKEILDLVCKKLNN